MTTTQPPRARAALLQHLQTVKNEVTVNYRGRVVSIDKVMDHPVLMTIWVEGWRYGLSVSGQDTNHALEAVRDIDQLIDIIEEEQGEAKRHTSILVIRVVDGLEYWVATCDCGAPFEHSLRPEALEALYLHTIEQEH